MKKRTANSQLAQKIKNGKKAILYELLPPPRYLPKVDIDRSFSLFSAMIRNYPIDAINIPEVRDETRNGQRQDTEILKLEPRTVVSYLRRYTDIDLIINRPVVYLPWKKQKKWLDETCHKFGIHTIILVGGESSKQVYPGFSVTKTAELLKGELAMEFPDTLLGGITIPTRDQEAKRVLQKSLSGIEFFTTQIIYESAPIKKLLKSYWELCQKKKLKPKMLFLSFAPVTTARDADLLQWLGVEIPKETRNVLTTGWLGMGWRSLQICQDILEDILLFAEKEKIRVPLGLNVEHVNRHNLETSFILLERLSDLYYDKSQIERARQISVNTDV